MKNNYFLVLILITLSGCTQSSLGRTTLGRKHAEEELRATLNGDEHNVLDNKTLLLKDSTTAIQVAETILFGIYGEYNITKQRPYEAYLINNYWIINGTLPRYSMGGTFLIIIDARSSEVLRVSHGK